MTELERIVDFVRALRSRAAGREEPFPFGVAHFHHDLPRVRIETGVSPGRLSCAL